MAPDFFEEFASSIMGKKDSLKEKILRGKPNPLANDFREHFKKIWIPLNEAEKFSTDVGTLKVAAVDSSVYTNLMSTGGIFYIIRALAMCRDSQRKLLDTDMFFTKTGLLEAQQFISRKMEMLEFQAAIDTIKQGPNCDTILMDGSLYGRASAFPIETKVEGERLLLLNYFQSYSELLDLYRKKGIMLLGVSKESRSMFYRDYILRLIFNETLNDLVNEIEPGDLQRLQPLFPEMLYEEEQTIKKFERLKQKYREKLDRVELIFDEIRSSRPDYQWIMNLAQSPGYTRPLLVGPSEGMAKRLNQCLKDPAAYAKARFPVSYREKGKDFVSWASNILSGFERFPAFISLYILLDLRDSPIRVDIPCPDYTFIKTGWPKPIEFDVTRMLNVMVSGYCGLDCYNLWLKKVDEKVRLRKQVVDDIYFPLMEKQFETKIVRGRGYRRVKYP